MTHPPRARRRSRRLDAAFAAVVLVALVSLAEGVLALAGDPVGPVYTLKKGIRWTIAGDLWRKPFRMVESEREFQVTTNADGLRVDDPQAASDGRATLLMLGDSVVFGWGVDDGDDVPSAVERALGAAGRSVRVLNGGQPGFSAMQSYLLLREVGVGYAPRVVLLEFSAHNFRTASKPDSLVIDASGSSKADYWLAAHSRAYRALRRLVVLASVAPAEETRGGEIGEVGDPDPEARDVRVPPDDWAAILRAAAALGRDEDFRFAVSFAPNNVERLPRIYIDIAESLASEGELVVVDYTQPWLDAGGDRRESWLADDPGHYSPVGAEIVGRALAGQIVQDGLLP